MKSRTLWTVPSHVVMMAFAAIFLAYGDGYLDARRVLPVLAVNLFLYALIALTTGTLLHAAASAPTRARLAKMYRAQISVLMPLAFVVAVSFLSGVLGKAYVDEGPRYVMYPAYSATVVVLSMLLPFPEHRRRQFRWYLIVAFGVVVATVLIDVVRPGTFSILTNRAAGFARNPNTAGFLLVALCCAILTYSRARFIDLLVIGVTTIGVLATLSRGAAIMLAFVIVYYIGLVVRYAWRRGPHFVLVRLTVVVLLVGATYGATTMLLGQRMFTAASASSTRLGMLRGREEVVGRGDARIRVAQEAWEMIRESPLLGYGSGYTYVLPTGPHNIFLSRWLDNGVLGVVGVVWLLAAMGLTFWKRRYHPGIVFTGVITLEGFFSHNLFEERLFFVLLGVLLTLSFEESPQPAPTRAPSRLPLWQIPRPLVTGTAESSQLVRRSR